LVTRPRRRTGKKVDSMGLEVFRCTQCSAEESYNVSSRS
jgi:hypothetical protein